ncbi:MAG TPA: hypothetical protein VK638_43210 [Edaphobacter sp.]|nr:hypothetical protein [Edaphobacter sp.]
MSQTGLSALVERLYSDASFRERFAAMPAQVLLEAGFDPTMFALPATIDPDDLEQRLAHLFDASKSVHGATDKKDLAANELWKGMSLIELSKDLRDLIPSKVSDSPVIVYPTILGVTTGLPEMDQLKVLRKLSSLPKEQLTFTVAGPDGVAAHTLSADVLTAFMSRLK